METKIGSNVSDYTPSTTSTKHHETLKPITVCGTWPFCRRAVGAALEALTSSDENRDEEHQDVVVNALQKGAELIERDPNTGVYICGVGGFPASNGRIQLDAAVMDGRSMRVGCVAAIESVESASAVAQRLLPHQHSMLVGPGAMQFAREQGFEEVDISTAQSNRAYQDYLDLQRQDSGEKATSASHDTMSLIGMDAQGHMATLVTTSGMAFKHPGRVGDSALPGSGFYADDEVGSCVATGDGDHIMRFCPCVKVIEQMRQGTSAKAACVQVLKDIEARLQRAGQPMFEVALLAMDNFGRVSAASTVATWTDPVTATTYPGFPYVVGQAGSELRIEVEPSCILESSSSSSRTGATSSIFPKVS